MTGEPLYKLSTVAERLDLSARTMQKYVRVGAINVVRVGPNQLVRVRESEVKRFIDGK